MTTKSDIDGVTANPDVADTPKKRTRIVQRNTDHVYSASQHQGERYDTVADEKNHKRAAVTKAKEDKAAAIHALESEVLVPPRKNRGRPSKAYLEAQRAYEEAVKRQQAQIAEARAALAGTVTALTENTEVEESPTTHIDEDIPEFVRMQQDASTSATNDNVTEPDENGPEAKESAPATNETSPVSGMTANESISSKSTGVSLQDVGASSDTNDKYPRALLQRLAEAKAMGQHFIIDVDVPVIPSDGYYAVNENGGSVSKNGHSIINAAKSLVESLRTNASDTTTAAAGSTFEKGMTMPAADAPKGQSDRNASQKPLFYNKEIIITAEGVLDIDNQGVGYLRSSDYNYMPSPDDVFVSQQQIRANNLRHGDTIECKARAPREGEKYYALTEIVSINGRNPIEVRDRISFEHLTPLFPDEQFRLSRQGVKAPLSCRIVDLFAPIGKGQRALIVAQPKTGKTILMKQIANAIAAHYPDTYLMMLLIDERPEEVTDMARTVNAEVIASTFDEPAKRHVRIANLVLEKAKRMVECGRDVVIFLDSITRLARAFNTEAPTSGKILTGGVDANALQRPKRFFGAARNIEGGGSLTIIATALIETGSKMDEVIFEEFKGTGNMELQLDRTLANKRIFPAVNLVQSSTRREDLLLDENTINRMFITRNFMADMSPIEAMNFIRKHLESTISNEEFIATIDK